MFQDKVVYQIYPKSFLDTNGDGVGDIPGIISKLDYLANLGVDYLWLSPIHPSPQHDNGYDIADYYGIDPMFGTLEDYKTLISEAGKRNIGILLDLVLNHTSDDHDWFVRSCQREAPYEDYYVWSDTPNDLIGFFSKSAWTYSEEREQYYLHLFDTHQPDLNWHNPKVREELCTMVNYWLDLGVKGFRLDVIDLIGKEPERMITAKGPKFYEYLGELQQKTFKKDFLTVGECWNASLEEARSMTGPKGLTQVFDFNHLTSSYGESKWDQGPPDFTKISAIIQKWQNGESLSRVVVMNNHDMPRLISLWLNDTTYRYEAATLLATFFTLLRGTQYIYQGEEIGLPNAHWNTLDHYQDVETLNFYQDKKETLSHDKLMKQIERISRDNGRTPIPWTSSLHSGFTTGTPWIEIPSCHKGISVERDLQNEKSVYHYYQKLIAYKKEHFTSHIDVPIDTIDYINGVWRYRKGDLLVVCNMSSKRVSYSHISSLGTLGKPIFSNYPEVLDELQPYQAIVWELDNEL